MFLQIAHFACIGLILVILAISLVVQYKTVTNIINENIKQD